jgi:uncharacterized protein (DUF2062 family)
MLTRSYAGSIGKTKKTLQSDLPMLVTPFELWNCGSNVPQVEEGAAIVAQQFDMRPNPTTGVISGATYRLDQILCGNVNSTEWVVSTKRATTGRRQLSRFTRSPRKLLLRIIFHSVATVMSAGLPATLLPMMRSSWLLKFFV